MQHRPTLKQLQYLVTLAEMEHFGAAAERCFVTQSTLSAGIRELENLLGAPVAERSNRQVLMTPLGRRLAERAAVLLRDADDLVDMARAERRPLGGDLHLGVIPTVSPFLLPKVLPTLARRFPELRLYLREEQTEPLLDRLRKGAIDVALIAFPYSSSGFATDIVMEDEFLFACAADHPYADLDTVSLASLSSEPLMLLEEGHCLRGHTLEICALGRQQLRVQFEASSLHTLVQMVASGIGVTLIPKLAVEAGITEGTNIVVSPMRSPAARQLGLIWRQQSLRTDEYRLLGEALRSLVPEA
ncbi:MAG: hydrogen peroxide-inducible genes activator [Pseudomonadota bacterium]